LRTTLALGIVVLLATSTAAPAQIATTGPAALARQMPTVYAPYLANISRVRILQRQGKLNPSRGSVRTSKPPPPTSPAPGKTPTGSVPSTATTVFHSVQPAFVPRQFAERLGKTADEQKYIETVLMKCLNFYTDSAREKGVPLNDVARALNYYIATNYYVYSLGAGPNQAEMDATRDNIRANMLSDETFLQMSDRQKQEAYETLIVLAGFVDLGYGTARKTGDQNTADQFRDMAKHNLETLLGASVDKMHFTKDGLVLN
jgi:hypothetical protein